MRYQVVSMDNIIEQNVYAEKCKIYRAQYTCVTHDIYAPIMVILFANVKFAHSVTMSNLCSYIDL